MRKRKNVLLSAVLLLLTAGVVFAQGAGAQNQPARNLPRVSGTVTRWVNDRIELKTAEGKILKVAINSDTKREVPIKEGVKLTVEYRRKVSDFIIALRVLAAEEGVPEAHPGEAEKPSTVTGQVVTWNSASLLLRTDAGDVTLFLAPTTKYEVKSLDPGLLVIVEYQTGANDHKVATLVRAAETNPG